MSQKTKNQVLTEQQRTIVLSDEQSADIYRMLSMGGQDTVTESIEVLIQEILNANSGPNSQFGNAYFTLRSIRDFYAKTHEMFWPLCQAIRELPADERGRLLNPWVNDEY